MQIKEATDDNFSKLVLTTGELVMVYFYSNSCINCNELTPVLLQSVQELGGGVEFVKLKIDSNKMIANEYLVKSAPTVIFFKNGKSVGTFKGFRSKDFITKIIQILQVQELEYDI